MAPFPANISELQGEAIDGKLYIVEYDIAARTWTRKADMNAAREHFRMAAVGNRINAAAGRRGGIITRT